jgi:hypothetical protein
MPASAAESAAICEVIAMAEDTEAGTAVPAPPPVPGQSLAVAAEALYLTNLLLLPGLGFIALVGLYLRVHKRAPELAACHLRQTLSASVWAGLILVLVNALIILAGGYHAPYTWVFVILYFTICHTSLVLLGMLGLARAMAGKPFRFPLVGMANCGS